MLSKDPYTTETEYTYEEYRKMCLAVTLHNPKIMMVIAGMEALYAVMTAIFIKLDHRAFMLIGITLLVAWPVFMMSRINTYIKNSCRSATTKHNTRSRISFKEDHLESVSNIGKSRLPYSDISRILENSSRYYIFGRDNVSYIIKKENCSPELSEKLKNLAAEHRKEVKA